MGAAANPWTSGVTSPTGTSYGQPIQYQPVAQSQPAEKSSAGRTAAKVVGVIVLILLLLALVPLPLQFSTTMQSYAVNPSYSTIASNCVSVSGSWSTSSGDSVTFAIENSAGTVLYTADAASGSFSFSGGSGPFVAGAYSLLPESVSVSGTCWWPVLNVGLP